MKINIKQEGGFIGMASKAKLDYKNLTEEEQKTLNTIAEKAVADMEQKAAENANPRDLAPASGILEPPTIAVQSSKLLAPMPMPADTFSYSLSMKKDGKKVDVAFDDTNAPPELVAFFQKYIPM
jgi:hypothetical protein